MLIVLFAAELVLCSILLLLQRKVAMFDRFKWPAWAAILAFVASMLFVPTVYADVEWKNAYFHSRVVLYLFCGIAYLMGRYFRRTKLEWLVCSTLICSVQWAAQPLAAYL